MFHVLDFKREGWNQKKTLLLENFIITSARPLNIRFRCVFVCSCFSIAARWCEKKKKSNRLYWHYCLFIDQRYGPDWVSVGGTVLIVHSGNGKTGWRNVSWGLFTHQHVCVCVLVLMKDKHSSWKSRCSPSWKVCDNLKRGCLISWERQRASGNSWPQSEWSHTPTGFGVFVWGCVCVWVEFCVSICSCLHVNVDVCWCVCVCVCFLGSWTNKGRGPVDEPIKEQEEWEEDTPTQHALPITQIRDGKWSKNNQDVMKLFRAFRFGW